MQRCQVSLQLEICPPSEGKGASENYFDQYIHLTGPPRLKGDDKSVALKFTVGGFSKTLKDTVGSVVELEDVDEKEKGLEAKQEQLQKEKDQLQKEVQRMSEINKIQDSCIKLNIGGHLYTTSILTLAKGPQSMLAAMFSGRHSVKKEEDGSYFIDRDGTHFRYILNYLRDGGFKNDSLPSDRDIQKELLTEAEYYQLSGLVALLQRILSADLSNNVTVPKCVKMPYKSVALKSTVDGFSKTVDRFSKTLQDTVGSVVELEEMAKDVSKTQKELDEKETELEAKQDQLQKEKDQLQDEIQKETDQLQKDIQKWKDQFQNEKDQLQKEKDQLQKEIQLMSDLNKICEKRIKLDIGGHIYATSVLTLTKDPQSMLATMFSGRHSVKKEEDGSYFIDRDGTHFRYILNYLRDGGFKEGMLPGDILTELQTEAEYYQLSGLVALLRGD